jgi:WYL domain
MGPVNRRIAAEQITRRRRALMGTSWSQERRLEFIEFRLIWEGRINRGELVDFFGISIQQASLDFARYIEVAPGNLEYDKSDKTYKANRNIRSVFTKPDSQAFLDQMSQWPAGPSAMSFIGWRPAYDVVKYPTRSIRTKILMRVLWAIRDRQDIEVSYQSMRRPESTRRWLSPHAIASDGFRWHTRAWCHDNRYFKDFVLARIQEIHRCRPSQVKPDGDTRWHSFATVVLRANRNLTPGQRTAVETEFGMREGELEVRMRECLVPYFSRLLPLDPHRPALNAVRLLEWINAHEFESLITEAASQ